MVDAQTFRRIGFIPTGSRAHGLYPSRDSRYLFVSNRGEGSISVISFATRKVVHKWRIPAEAAPTWVACPPTARCSGSPAATTASSTRSAPTNGHLLARIPVGDGPHGVCFYPLPGRYSLGHTDNMR